MAEPVKWITINGAHVPVYEDGSIGKPDIKKNPAALAKKLKEDDWQVSKGTLAETGEPVVMVVNGQMADGSLTYVKGETVVDDIFDAGIEDDGYLRQYQRDRRHRFYLMTEDRV